MSFTPAQLRAIVAAGNVLVMAGAGTGKTRTLVERCVRRLLAPTDPVSLEAILMVTFTEAAASEMRQRIRARLEAELDAQPENARLAEQLALLDSARICTLHSFCLELVREHFHELALDPQVTVLDPDQARLLAAETLNEMFRAHYAADSPESDAVRQLVEEHGGGRDQPIRELILRLHEFTQTRPDPEGWFARELERFAQTDPLVWRQWLHAGFETWRQRWQPCLRAQAAENANAHTCAAWLEGAGTTAGWDAKTCLQQILATSRSRPRGQKGRSGPPLTKFYEEATFLDSLLAAPGAPDPLAEDWSWVRTTMATLLRLAREFAQSFAQAKRNAGRIDFHDLEQFALRLLWNATTGRPTPVASRWRERLQLVFVDEYQDINPAQDAILAALSREGADANRFLVGDVKQSIYRFRQAAPHIFQGYAERWRQQPEAQVIALCDNFRSAEPILRFLNAFFAGHFRPEAGGVTYDEQARLRFARSPQPSVDEPAPAVAGPPVEILLRLTDADNESPGDADDAVPAEADPATLLEEEKEARMVGLRLRELHASRVTVWDAAAGAHRPVAWGDMVILLRAPALKVESYAKEFDRLGIPLQAKRSGFFQSIEVLDLLNILRLLDNPLQDIPAIAVLRSPLVGLSLDELADIRMAARRERFWTALLRWHDMERERARADGAAAHSAWPRVEAFLKQFQRWRDLARHSSLARRLEIILSETCYLDWLAAQPRGAQRRANVQLLLTLAREFDELHQQGLYRFLQMIEDHHETVGDREPAPLETADAVRLMSIHQSKGLEFPVVVVADLGKRFNVSDNGGGILLDDEFGLCPYVRPPDGGPSYPSLPAWLARRRQHAEALGEEMRLLYVAMTRAEDRLILAGSVTAKKAESAWADHAAPQPELWRLLQAGSYFDWLGPWLTHHAGRRDWFHAARGHTELWAWRVCREADLTAAAPPHGDMTSVPQADLPSPDPLPSLLARLAWTYPHQAATREPAKTSVTALRQRLADVEDDESRPAAWLARERFTSRPPEQGTLDAAAIGNAHHRFLQLVRLDQTADLAGLEAERRRLASAGLLAAPEVAALDLVALARFWSSDLGREIRARAAWVRRELPFTLRLGPEDCPEGLAVGVPPSEFIVVQGVVDLAVLLPEEIWLLDFKTDAVDASSPEERAAHYAPQVRLYRLALERIHRRPVTRCWLHFLAIGRTVSVPAHPAPTGPEPRAANEPG